MEIVQVCPRYYPYMGGVEKHVREISSKLVEKGFRIKIFATDPYIKSKYTEENIDGILVKKFKSYAFQDTIYFSYPLLRALKKTRADIVHAHGYRALPMLEAALAKDTNKAKFIVTTHLGFSKMGKWLYKIYNPIFGKLILTKAEKIIIVSPVELEELPILKSFKEKLAIIPIGIKIPQIDMKQKLIKKNKLTLIYVGRIEKRKGIGLLVELMKKLDPGKFQLIIVGSGPYRNKLIQKIRENKLDNLSYKGKISDKELQKLLFNSELFISLSEYESHSVALTEAMSYGVVPIVTDVGGNKHIIDSSSGFLVRYPVNVDEIAKTLNLLSNQREIIRLKALKARKTVAEKYGIHKIVEQISTIYENAVINR
nr:glycosyltransferase family 4 protein [Candidatus Baldrarchaeota archaeon]